MVDDETYSKWFNMGVSQLSGYNVRGKAWEKDRIVFAVDHYFACPICDKRQVARYHVPQEETEYYECGHSHKGLPQNPIE